MSTIARKNGGRGGKARKTPNGPGQTSSGSVACPSCGSRAQGGARYCQHCGKSLSGGGWLTPQTMTVLASAVVVLVALALLFASVIDIGNQPVATGPTATTPPRAAAGQPPDLSTMSPREAADRLFNRVMMADEQGNRAEVEQFTPMAVSAYEMLESMDADALYHVGLIHAAAGDIEKAKEFTERMKAIVPNHLLAALLEHRLAEEENKQSVADRAAERFHKHYDEEISIGRLEYEHHRASIERFRANIAE